MDFFMGAWAPEKVSCGCQGGRWAEAAVDTGLGCEAAGCEAAGSELPTTALGCCSLLRPSLQPAGRGSPFPGRKCVPKAARRRSPSCPARSPAPAGGCSQAPLQIRALQARCTPLQRDPGREELVGLWMDSAVPGKMNQRASATELVPAMQPHP